MFVLAYWSAMFSMIVLIFSSVKFEEVTSSISSSGAVKNVSISSICVIMSTLTLRTLKTINASQIHCQVVRAQYPRERAQRRNSNVRSIRRERISQTSASWEYSRSRELSKSKIRWHLSKCQRVNAYANRVGNKFVVFSVQNCLFKSIEIVVTEVQPCCTSTIQQFQTVEWWHDWRNKCHWYHWARWRHGWCWLVSIDTRALVAAERATVALFLTCHETITAHYNDYQQRFFTN